MTTIHFKYENEKFHIYRQVKSQLEMVERDQKISYQIGKCFLSIHWHDLSVLSIVKKTVVDVLTAYIIHYRERKIIESMIEQSFFFCEGEEKRQILTNVYAIMDGEKPEIPNQPKNDRRTFIKQAFHTFLSADASFEFESFLMFRLNDYYECLMCYIQLAIDEYMLEQEYQTFIHELRTYVYTRKTMLKSIHLFHDDYFYVFNHRLEPLTDYKMQHMIDPYLLKKEEFQQKSSLLVPLLSMAPQKIYIYTKENEHGLIQTIQNVFQERVCIKDQQHFPLKKGKPS